MRYACRVDPCGALRCLRFAIVPRFALSCAELSLIVVFCVCVGGLYYIDLGSLEESYECPYASGVPHAEALQAQAGTRGFCESLWFRGWCVCVCVWCRVVAAVCGLTAHARAAYMALIEREPAYRDSLRCPTL